MFVTSTELYAHQSTSTAQTMDNPNQDPVCVDCVNTDWPKTVADKIQKLDLTAEGLAGDSVALDALSVEDICDLLDHSKLSAISVVVRENQFSGNILATGVERLEDLKEYGIKSILAQSFYRHIIKWKENGVPANIFTRLTGSANEAAEAQVTGILANDTPEDGSVKDAVEKYKEEAERQREALVAEWRAKCDRLERERDAAQRLASLRMSCIDRKHNWPPLGPGQRHSRCEGCNTWGYQSNGVWCEGY